MFLGTYTPKLDDKGRLTLPAKFREDLAGGLMVTKGQDHSLAVYPKEEFVKLAQRATKASRTNAKARAFIRNLAASTDEQRPDGSGRIKSGAPTRDHADNDATPTTLLTESSLRPTTHHLPAKNHPDSTWSPDLVR